MYIYNLGSTFTTGACTIFSGRNTGSIGTVQVHPNFGGSVVVAYANGTVGYGGGRHKIIILQLGVA